MKIEILISTIGRDGGEQYERRIVTLDELRNIGQDGFRDLAAQIAHNFYRVTRHYAAPNSD